MIKQRTVGRVELYLLVFHGTMTGIWFFLIFPSIFLWKTSIEWLVLMSVWANFAAHFAATMALLVEYLRRKSKDK